MDNFKGTKPVYQYEGHLRSFHTNIVSIQPISSLPSEEQALFKLDPSTFPSVHVLVTEETIFYPQGGGQPTDVGTLTSLTTKTLFNVLIVRNAKGKRTLHFGTFASPDSTFFPGEEVKQEIDGQKRLLYSRIHTAGHILGLAVGQLPDLIPDVVDTKAQHYPDAAYVEFKGFIDGKHKDAIQAQTDELVKQKLPVKLHWWDMDELKEKCAAVLEGFEIPEGEKARAVEIVGAGAYPCGGTHVEDSSGVGKIMVGKIKRSKGMTKISYTVVPNE